MSVGLDQRFEDLIQELAQRFAALELGAQFLRILPGLVGIAENLVGHACLAKRIEIGDPFPRRRQVDPVPLVLHLGRAENLPAPRC